MENMVTMFGNAYKGKKVLITGNTGFKGSWLTTWLLSLGAKVCGISKDIPSEPSMFKELKLEQKITHFFEDIRNLPKIKEIINSFQPDFLFHLAAQPIVSKSFYEPLDTISSNVVGTANILEVLRECTYPCTAIIITSDKCYENHEWEWGYRETDHLGGKDIYSGSKAAAEIIFKSYYRSYFENKERVKIATGRAGNVIGGGDWAQDRIVADCIKAWSNNEKVIIRNPNATRPWQHVLEPLSGYLTLAWKLSTDERLNGEQFNFGPRSEQNRKVIDLIFDLSKTWTFNTRNAIDFLEIIETNSFREAGLLKLNCDKALYHLNWHANLNYQNTVEFVGTWYYDYYTGKQDMYEYTLNQISMFEQSAQNNKLEWALN